MAQKAEEIMGNLWKVGQPLVELGRLLRRRHCVPALGAGAGGRPQRSCCWMPIAGCCGLGFPSACSGCMVARSAFALHLTRLPALPLANSMAVQGLVLPICWTSQPLISSAVQWACV